MFSLQTTNPTGISPASGSSAGTTAQSAIEARDNDEKMLFYCPGDWVFNAPVPDGLNTYTALDEIAKELQEV